MKITTTDRKELQLFMAKYSRRVWLELCHLFPQLSIQDMPTVKLNFRFSRTLGCCYPEQHRVEFSGKALLQDAHTQQVMLDEVVAHELAHYADYLLHGLSEASCGHGSGWTKIMRALALEPAKSYQVA